MRRHVVRILLLAMTLLLFGNTAAIADTEDPSETPAPGGWTEENGDIQYYMDGEPAVGVFADTDGVLYYADADGTVRTEEGFFEADGSRYFSRAGGGLITGEKVQIGKADYVFDSTGRVKKWLFTWNGQTYYANGNGELKTSGFVTIKSTGARYYFGSSGAAATGFFTVGGKQYYSNSSGVIRKWLFTEGGHTYYANGKGELAVSRFVTISSTGKKYYFNRYGAANMGLWKAGSEYYYSDRSGVIRTAPGRFTYNGDLYISRTGGVLYRNRFIVSGKDVYYAGDNAVIKKSSFRLAGFTFTPDANGKIPYAQYTRLYGLPKADLLTLAKSAPSSSSPQTFHSGYVLSKTTKGKALLNYVTALRKSYKVSFLVIDLNTGQGISCLPDRRMYAASCLKGPYVAAINRYYPDRAKKYWGLEKSTVVNSNNDSYRTLWRLFGASPIRKVANQCGAKSWDGTRFPYITTRDLAKIWVETYWYLYKATNKNSASLRSLYTHGTQSFLYKGLKSRWTVNSKPGWIKQNGYRAQNDAGIVMAKVNGVNTPYLIVVMTNAYGQQAKLQKLVRLIDDVHTDMMK